MDYKAILNLMKEMNHTDLTKLEIEEEGVRICMEKAANTAAVIQQAAPVTMAPAMQAVPVQMPVMQGQSAAAAPAEASQAVTADKKTEEADSKKIVAPMVGTFYLTPGPDKAPFVKPGDKIKKGQTVCIIEAMKLMNEIESEFDGEIIQILVKNDEMVEFGQPLFLVK